MGKMVAKGDRAGPDNLEQQALLETMLRTIFLTALTAEGQAGEACKDNGANKERQVETEAMAVIWSLKEGLHSPIQVRSATR
jgi:hypothetical protein